MINSMQTAIIKKDLRSVFSDKQLLPVLIIVPLVLTVILPSVFILASYLAPDASDFQVMIDMMPVINQSDTISRTLMSIILNNLMPIFFILVPIMSASTMAASSFVGEKEKRTLETLLYCPLSVNQIFQSKVIASFILSMIVSFASFVLMLIVTEVLILLMTGSLLLPDIRWLIIMLVVSPALSLFAITMIVSGSAKAKTVEGAQQRTVFLIMPFLLLIAGQFAGIILVNAWILLGIGAVFAALSVVFLKRSRRKFTYETLLR